MFQLIRIRNVIQLRSCVNLLNYRVDQISTLTKKIHSNHQLNNEKLNDLKKHNIQIDLVAILGAESNKLNKSKFSNLVNCESLAEKENDSKTDESNLPSEAQLEKFRQHIEEYFPKIFRATVNLNYADKDVLIQDYQSGTIKEFRGYWSLYKRLFCIKMYHLWRYTENIMVILSIVKLPKEGLVKVRWRSTSKGRLFTIIKFWDKKNYKRKEYFTDGIIHFYVNSDGKAHHIIIEKMEKDELTEFSTIIQDPLKKVAKV